MKKLLFGFFVLASSFLMTPASYAQGCAQYLSILCADSKEFTPCEETLIYTYTRGLYIPLNEHLRKINENQNCVALAKNLVSAVNKLRTTGKNVTYRGIRRLDILKTLKIGECFTDHGFLSTSEMEASALDFVRYEPEVALLEITASSGRSISKFSDYPYEKEILLLPDTILKLEQRVLQSDRVEKLIFNEVKKSECSIVLD